MNLDIDNILSKAVESSASDIHLTIGKKIIFRIEGKLTPIDEIGELDVSTMKKISTDLLLNNVDNLKKLYNGHDLDFAYQHNSGTSFRVNGFYRLGKLSFVLRQINSKVKSIQELGLPNSVEYFTDLKQGLLLITGPTGAGKSTTMISLLNEINNKRSEHILTIEDPIEYIFEDNKSMFSQREVGRDTDSFEKALKSSLREDPNVIVIGEMRDVETVKAALDLAETGHLVISTLHTSSSAQTITRLVNFFPLEYQEATRTKIADNLAGVISQRLIPKKDNSGRVGIFEVMMANTAIRNLIRSGKLEQIRATIETSTKNGMITMGKYAEFLEKKGIIKKEDYANYFRKDDR